MSSLVHTIAYIKLPMDEAYGTLAMKPFSLFVYGKCFLYDLKWFSRGVLTT